MNAKSPDSQRINIKATENAVVLPACYGLPTESNPFWVSALELESRQPENINVAESATISLACCFVPPPEYIPCLVSEIKHVEPNSEESRQLENINAIVNANILHA